MLSPTNIRIHFLHKNKDGTIRVVTNKGTANNVSRNVVRCALGERDMEYLLGSNTKEEAFSITESEFMDMLHQ